MRARPSLLAASAFLALLGAAATASAQAKIEAADGGVRVSPAGMKVWIAVSTPPYTLKDGDRIRSDKGASVAISFPDHSRAQLAEESSLTVAKVTKTEAALTLEQGVLKSWVSKGLSRHYRVTTPSALVTVHGTEFSVQVTPTRDTQVEVDKGEVAVKIKSGEEAILGPDLSYRSLLVIPGRTMALLPHPREERVAAKSSRKMTDCLHKPNGALRGSVEEIEACQNAGRDKDLTPSEARALREHQRAELRLYLQATGVLPSGGDADATAADGGTGEAASDGGRDRGAETAALMKEMGLPEPAASGPLAGLSPDKIKMLQDAMTKQGTNPAVQAAFGKAIGGKGQLSTGELQSLIQSLHLDKVDLDHSQKAALPAEP